MRTSEQQSSLLSFASSANNLATGEFGENLCFR